MSEPKQISTKMNAYQLVQKMREQKADFYDAFESLGKASAQTNEELEELQKILHEIASTIEDKIANTVHFIDHIDEIRYSLQGQADYHEERLAEIKSRLSSLDNSKERLKENVHKMMDEIEVEKVRVDDRTIYIQEYERLDISELTEEDKDDLIKANYGELRQNKYIDKRKLKEALDTGMIDADDPVAQHIKLEKTKSLRGI